MIEHNEEVPESEGVHEHTPGFMLAFSEDGELGVGKVTHIGEKSLNIVVYQGHLTGQWLPTVDPCGKEVTREIRKASVIDGLMFALTPSNKLPGNVKEKLERMLKG